MAKQFLKYKDINQVLRAIRTQVIDSYDYYLQKMPMFDSPEQMFNSLKTMVTYKHDPPGIELLQSVQTLFSDNYWGIAGAGDCDCFSILILTACQCHGWTDQRIVLAGRSKAAPVHIWTEVYFDGDWHAMDLTQPYYNTTRDYPLVQYLEV